MNSNTRVLVTLEVKDGKRQDVLNILNALSEQAKKEESFLMIYVSQLKILMNC